MLQAINLILILLFEPIGVFAVIGLMLFLHKCIVDKNRNGYLLIGGLLFAIFWRVVILEIITTRYANILLYPGLLCAVYGCRELPKVLFPKKGELFKKRFAYLLFSTLFIVCIIKVVKIDSYINYLQDSAKVLKTQKQDGAVVYSYPKDSNRIQHYANYDITIAEELELTGDDVNYNDILSLINVDKFSDREIWLVTRENSETPLLKASLVGLEERELEAVAAFSTNKEQERFVHLYKITPIKKIEKSVTPIKDITEISFQGTEEINGSFDKRLSPEHFFYKEIEKELQLQKVENLIPEGYSFPSGWSILGSGEVIPVKAQLYIDHKNSILNGDALQVKSIEKIKLFHFHSFPSASYKVQFLVKGESGTKVRLGVFVYGDNDEDVEYRNLEGFTLDDDNIYQVNYMLDERIFTECCTLKFAIILEGGSALFDDFNVQKF